MTSQRRHDALRIVHLITDLSRGGAQTMLLRLLADMDRDRFHSTVVSLRGDGPTGAELRDIGIPVYTVDMSPTLPTPFAVFRLWRLLRRLKPDLLQTWLYHSDLFGWLAGRLAGLPHIVWNLRCAHMDERYYSGRHGAVVSLLARLSSSPDAIIANSFAGRDLHQQRGYHPKRWLVLPNGFDTGLFRPMPEMRPALCRELGLDPRSLLIGLVARDDPIKDHPTFLRAAALCARTLPDARFILVGAGMDQANTELNAWIDDLDLHARVHLLGERADIPQVTAAFDIATCSSRSEGFPNVVGEAMACGVPMVATDVGDSARLIGDAGLVVPAGDAAAFAGALAELARLDERQRHAMGRRGRQRITESYSIDRAASRYADLYVEICAAEHGMSGP